MFSLYNRYCITDFFQVSGRLRAAEAELRHNLKLFLPNAWMKVLHFNVLTSCPKDELHQWFIGLYGEHIIPAIVQRYTQGITQGQPCLWDQRLPNFGRPQPRVGGLSVAKTERIRRKSRSEAARRGWKTRNARKRPAEEEESRWRYMTCISLTMLTYTYHIWLLSKTCFSGDCVMSRALECIFTCWFRLAVTISLLFLQSKRNWLKNIKILAYIKHMLGLYWSYTTTVFSTVLLLRK